jgi:hypothetical protein
MPVKTAFPRITLLYRIQTCKLLYLMLVQFFSDAANYLRLVTTKPKSYVSNELSWAVQSPG